MLKVYLDWNCITAAKTKHPFLLDVAEKFSHVAVFPYSKAHLSDVLVSRKEHPVEFKQDVDTLRQICSDHLLQFHDHRVFPHAAFPEEVVEKEGDMLELIQTLTWMRPDTYQTLKKFVKEHLPEYPLAEIQFKTKPEDVMMKINSYISEHTSYDSLLTFMGAACSRKDMVSPLFQFQLLNIGLDMFGYKTEDKRKSLTNIMADASHMFMAANCEYFVTLDKILRDKAKAIYAYYKCKTKVIHLDELLSVLTTAHGDAFSFDYMHKCIRDYGTPRIEDDGLHYTLLPTPFLGFFNACMTGESLGGQDAAWVCFKYSFGQSPYLFNSELDRFLNILCGMFPEEKQNGFWHLYAEPIHLRDMESAKGRSCTLLWTDAYLQFTFLVDTDNSVPLPMLKVEKII